MKSSKTNQSRTPKAALEAQQKTLRKLIKDLTKTADRQKVLAEKGNPTWEDVSEFAMDVELAKDLLYSLAESIGSAIEDGLDDNEIDG